MSSTIDAEVARAIALRERIHQDPELGRDEHRTSKAIREALDGLTVQSIAGTGLIVRAGPTAGPQVLLRAELDALPLAEQTGAPWASTTDVMHACGHDVHAAALVAAVRILASRPFLPAGLVALFQPAEESTPNGARDVLADAAFRELELSAAIGMHVHPGVQYGEVALALGPINASVDDVAITIRGHGGHAAYPHETADPVVGLAMVVVALQQIVSRRTDPLHPAVLSLTTLRAGSGTNLIPSEAHATGTLRCLDSDDRARLRELIEQVTTSTAAAAGCTAQVTLTAGEPLLVNDPGLVAAVAAQLDRGSSPVPLERSAVAFRSCGADDLAEYGVMAPTLMGFVGLAGHPDFQAAPLHSSRFLPPRDAVGAVTAALVAAFDGVSGGMDLEPGQSR